MPDLDCDGKCWKATLCVLVLAMISSCDTRFPPEESKKGSGGPPQAVLRLEPDTLAIRLNASFACSLQIANAPHALAGRFLIHFDTSFVRLQSATAFDSTKTPFFEWREIESEGPASLSILLAAPAVLPSERPLCTLTFRALGRTGSDSIYFARSSALTALRDTLNQDIPIGRFSAAKISIQAIP